MTNEAPGPSNLPRAGRNGSHPFFTVKGRREPRQTKLNDWQLDWPGSEHLGGAMPHGPRRDAEANGARHPRGVLRAQVARQLHDPKIARFTVAFSRQCLQLRRVRMFAPEKKLYPPHDDY